MNHSTFLLILSQLSSQKRAQAEVLGREIFLRKGEERWELSTVVFQGDGEIPPSVRASVSSSGTLRWEQEGPYLKLDAASSAVFLVYEMDSVPNYASLRSLIPQFFEIAAEWQEILKKFAEEDFAYI